MGLDGTTLSYETSLGWLSQPVPANARSLNLLSVAFAGPGSAFAVGQGGVILHWNGYSWSEAPGSRKLTRSQLNAVAFTPSGEGWAVGDGRTILHYNGTQWEEPEKTTLPPGSNVTSVSATATEAFAVVDGNLYTRSAKAPWHRVGELHEEQEVGEGLPTKPPPVEGALRLVSALPDGGVVAAGRSIMLTRQAHEHGFNYGTPPPEGIAVALAAFEEGGDVRAFVSVAPPAFGRSEVGGFPPGDGELLRQTAGGWDDLSGEQYAGNEVGKPQAPDGALKPDPVLALAVAPNGEHGWAVGGYAGTVDAAKQGTTEALSVRSQGWQTAAIWRYDIGGGASPPALQSTPPYLPPEESTISFAFFSSPTCFGHCSATVGAQPDVNLGAAAAQIASYATQPGGPSFAISGGDVATEGLSQYEESGGADLAHLSELLSPLGALPVFAAIGPLDYVHGETHHEGQAWGEAFAESPPPFGSGTPAGAITPISSEAPTINGDAHRYYSFDAHQNGGTMRVIVLDNSQRSLAESASADGEPPQGELAWLEGQLNQAQQEEQALGQHIPVVAVTALPLRTLAGTTDGDAIATLLARRGVAAVFTTNPRQRDERRMVPEFPRPGEPQVPEYEGGSLSYQQPGNNGALWYLVSVDTQTGQLRVEGVPVVNSLALRPLSGLNVARSQTLQFEAIARRPPGSLATVEEETPLAPGYENYVAMPVPGCSQCVSPAYAFTSSEPAVGQFVEPSGPGSPFPKLNGTGHPIPSSTSGLFCAYNSGTTIVSITTGLLTYSLPVTVEAGGFGPPCGTVPYAAANPVITILTARTGARNPGAAAPPPPPVSPASGALPSNLLAPPPSSPHPHPLRRRRRRPRRRCHHHRTRPRRSRRSNRRRCRLPKPSPPRPPSCRRPRRPSSRSRRGRAATPPLSARKRPRSTRASLPSCFYPPRSVATYPLMPPWAAPQACAPRPLAPEPRARQLPLAPESPLPRNRCGSTGRSG